MDTTFSLDPRRVLNSLIARPAVALLCALVLAPLGAPSAQAETRFEALLEKFGKPSPDADIYHSNGRIEAQTVDVATKYAGRISTVSVEEGDLLTAGAEIAQMDTADAAAQVNGAQAAVLRARAAKAVAEATLMQASSTLDVAQTNFERAVKLHDSGTTSQSVLDDATNALNGAKASVAMAKAQISDAEASIAASEAQQQQVQLMLNDLTIKAPIRGPGAVPAARAGRGDRRRFSRRDHAGPDGCLHEHLPARHGGGAACHRRRGAAGARPDPRQGGAGTDHLHLAAGPVLRRKASRPPSSARIWYSACS